MRTVAFRCLLARSSCKKFLIKIKQQTGAGGSGKKVVEELTLTTEWRTYLPPNMVSVNFPSNCCPWNVLTLKFCSDNCTHNEPTWVPTFEIDVLQDELNDSLKENEQLTKELADCQLDGHKARVEATKWRELHDVHLVY